MNQTNKKKEDYFINKLLFSVISLSIISVFILFFIGNRIIIFVLGIIIGSVITSNLFNYLLDIILHTCQDEELYNNTIIKFIRGGKQ